jgi:hypothetical protein
MTDLVYLINLQVRNDIIRVARYFLLKRFKATRYLQILVDMRLERIELHYSSI